MMHDIYWNYDKCFKYGIVDDLYTNYGNADYHDHYNKNIIEIKNLYSIKTDGDRILALNQTLPKKLKSIIINIKIFY